MNAERDRSGDDGYVAILVAVALPLFMILTAIAIDVANWYVQGQRIQRAADAAALAGAVYLPDDPTKAKAYALDLAHANGYTSGTSTITVDPGNTTDPDPTLAKPTKLRVTVTSTVDNVWGSFFGHPTTVITRTAVGDYAGPVPMGSPCNVFGNEQMETSAHQVGSSNCSSQAGVFWLNIAGTNVNKSRGDAFASGWCSQPDNPSLGIDGCASIAYRGGVNSEYTGRYVYGIRVTDPGPLDLQAYDAGYVPVNDGCDSGFVNGADTTVNPAVPDAATRYAKGKTAFCTGDAEYSGAEGDGSAVRTTFTLHAPSPSSAQFDGGPVLCTWTLPGITMGSTGQLKSYLTPGTPQYNANPWVAATYHRWADICPQFNASQTGDYALVISTKGGGGGQNRMALRATLGANNRNVSIYAAGAASFFNNVPAGASTFYLARLGSGAAGHTLRVGFFDLADASQPVDVTMLAPDSATGTGLSAGQAFTGCVFSGAVVQSNGSCTVQTVLSKTGGKWVQASIPIPADYQCQADTDYSRCWVRVQLSTTADQNDTTTWTASLDGDPVRLVE